MWAIGKTSLMILLVTKDNSGLVATLQERESVDKIHLGLLWRTAKQRRIFLGSKMWIENCKRKAAQMTWWHNSSEAGAGWTLDQVSRQTWFTLRLYHDLSKLYSCTITPSGQTTLFPNTVHSNTNIQTTHCGSNATLHRMRDMRSIPNKQLLFCLIYDLKHFSKTQQSLLLTSRLSSFVFLRWLGQLK